MKASLSEKLDQEVKERLVALNKKWTDGTPFGIEEIFVNKTIFESLETSKSIVSGFDKYKLLGTIPFNRSVYVQICAQCACVSDVAELVPFLDAGAIIPVLLR